MCGIAGFFARSRDTIVDAGLLTAMAEAQAHRGPDGQGVHVGKGYGLAQRRLAIIDTSADGAQPMVDHTGHLWVTFNGEIYNYLELRDELATQGCVFKSRSDTEVLLHGWRIWGEQLPHKLRGMFAFALVDEQRDVLFAARDRVGKKPFHYVETPHGLAFASEIKALLLPQLAVSRQLDHVGLAQFLCLRYVPDPRTGFAQIRRLPPGHTLRLERGKPPQINRYWQLSFAQVDPRSERELAEVALALLDEATKLRMIADVPLGAFLSGGVDSFAVVDAMARTGQGRVLACTMGFDDPRFDERAYARAAAAKCGAILHEGVVREAEMEEQSWFLDTFDEPFSDASAIPTYHVSKLARQHVTVALAGDGGDEAFAGYRRYRFDVLENRTRSWLPRALWSGLGRIYPKADFLPRALRLKRTFENLARDPAVAYARSVSASLPEEVLPLLRYADAGSDPLAPVIDAYLRSDGRDPLTRAAAADFATNLPGDILTKVDRASMANSLEVRAPLLDHRMLELAARVPSEFKIRGGQGKAFLRRALRERLGEAIERRPKQGFSVPLRRWLSGRLGDELTERLAGGVLPELVHKPAVAALLTRHRSGLRDHSELLWAVLVLGRFLARWQGQP